MAKNHKEFLVEDTSEEQVYHLLFERHGNYFHDDDSNLYLGVFGLPGPDPRIYEKDQTGTFPKWYICASEPTQEVLVDDESIAFSESTVIAEIKFVDDFSKGVLIKFVERKKNNEPTLASFIDKIITRLEQVTSVQILSDESTNDKENIKIDSDIYVPKKDVALERWQRAYPILVSTRERFREEWDKSNTEDPSPGIDDYRDALAYETNWKPSGRTIRRILNAGDAGLLG